MLTSTPEEGDDASTGLEGSTDMFRQHGKSITRIVMALILAAGIATAGLVMAQTSSTSASSDQLATLRQQAARLSLLDRLPAADRDAASSLLDQIQAVQQKAYELHVQSLQAYVDALNGGADQATAAAQAQQAVAAARTSLTTDIANLRSAVQSFVQQHPDAAGAFPAYGFGQQRGYGPAAGFGPGARQGLGGGFGYGPGEGYGPGMGYGRGMGYGPGMGYERGMGWGPGMGYGAHPRGAGPRW